MIRKERAIDYVMILGSALKAIQERDSSAISELSNHTIHDASIYQDEHSLTMAVMMYSVSKILYRKGSISKKLVKGIEQLRDSVQHQDAASCSKQMHEIMKIISEEDKSLKVYIEEVIHQAKVRKGKKLYEHGLSLSRAADLLGVSYWDLAGYVGKAQIESVNTKYNAKARLNLARRLFS